MVEDKTYTLRQPIPAIPVRSIASAQEFYAENFGWGSPWHHGEYGGMFFDGMQIHFLQRKDIHPIFLYNYVYGVDALYEHVKSLGTKIAAELKDHPYGMREFTALDPDGNFIAFAEQI